MSTSAILISNAVFTITMVGIAFALGLWKVRQWVAEAESRAATELVKQFKEETVEQAWVREELAGIDERFVRLEESFGLFEDRQARLALRRERDRT